jgi:hypothetical protein
VTDAERLDAIGEHGLCVATQDTLGPGGWTRVWVCHYDDRFMVGASIREVIDAAVADLLSSRH